MELRRESTRFRSAKGPPRPGPPGCGGCELTRTASRAASGGTRPPRRAERARIAQRAAVALSGSAARGSFAPPPHREMYTSAPSTLHYITLPRYGDLILHFISLRFIPHSIPFHSIPFHSIQFHFVSCHHITSHRITDLRAQRGVARGLVGRVARELGWMAAGDSLLAVVQRRGRILLRHGAAPLSGRRLVGRAAARALEPRTTAVT